MRNLNKYILLAGCCMGGFMSANVRAIAYDCEVINTSCSNLGYTDKKSTCDGNYIACPFNTEAAVCDREAYASDYKFSWSLPNTGHWGTLDSSYDGKFIVGAGSSYCGVSIGGTKTATIKSHTHDEEYSYTDASTGSRDKATADKRSDIPESATRSTNYTLAPTEYTYANGSTSYSSTTSDILPLHKYVRLYYFINKISSYTTDNNSMPSTQPTCASLGYVDTADQCPGTYIKCPFSSNFVMCDLQARVGEIKFSLQHKDHDGWLLCNGRTLSDIGSKYASSELNTSLGLTKLPNYNGVFLRVSKDSVTTQDAPLLDTIPSHSHTMTTASYITSYGSKDDKYSGKEYTYWQPVGKTATKLDQRDTSTNGDDETAPPHYVANVFIYSGKLNGGTTANTGTASGTTDCTYTTTCPGTYPYATESSALTACGTGNVISCAACNTTKYKCKSEPRDFKLIVTHYTPWGSCASSISYGLNVHFLDSSGNVVSRASAGIYNGGYSQPKATEEFDFSAPLVNGTKYKMVVQGAFNATPSDQDCQAVSYTYYSTDTYSVVANGQGFETVPNEGVDVTIDPSKESNVKINLYFGRR